MPGTITVRATLRLNYDSGFFKLSSEYGSFPLNSYVTLSIPRGVALRVHERLGYKSLKADLPSSNPLRVIKLRDLHAGVAKEPRHILKAHAAKQGADRERIA